MLLREILFGENLSNDMHDLVQLPLSVESCNIIASIETTKKAQLIEL